MRRLLKVSQQTLLTDNDKIALALRLRRILILTLLDYFNGTAYFNNLIIKELNELFEGIIKIMARNLGIPLTDSNGKRRGLKEIINNISNAVPHVKEVLIKIFNYYSQPLPFHNYPITIRDLRNAEAHGLNIPIIPREIITNVWRHIDAFIQVVDPGFDDFLKDKEEVKDVYHLYYFLKVAILRVDPNISVDYSKLKEEEKQFSYPSRYVRVDSRRKIVTVWGERNAWDIVSLIMDGKYEEAIMQ